MLLPNSPISSKIPPSQQNRLPSNIPLRTLTSRSEDQQSTSLLAGHRDQPSHGRLSSDSADSDIDSWTDTGDIAEQLAAEDPLRLHLADTSLNDELLAGVADQKRSRHKRVQFRRSVSEHSQQRSRLQSGVISKEAIEIPDIGPRRPSRGARLLAAIMPGTGIHGLTGKPLL